MAKFTYKYCPQCATLLTERLLFDLVRPACPSCDFVHFEDPKVAVVAFATCQGRVLLIQRAVDPESGKWAMPGGYMDAGELPEEALQRELLEEVGLAVNIEQLLGTHPLFHVDRAGVQENVGVVLIYQVSPQSDQLEELICQDDVKDAGWFLPDEVPDDLAFELTGMLLETWQP
ncbi:MAG: NUDIX hydrolase [Chloroflexota bacterium]